MPFVGPDNRAGARKVGEALAARLHAGDKVAIIEGIPTAFNGQQRRLGFEDAMNAAGMKIVTVQSGRWEMETASNVAAAMLNAHADLKAILCANDNMALGAVSAIQAAGRAGKVLVVGFDNISRGAPTARKGADCGDGGPARRPPRSIRHRGGVEDPEGRGAARGSNDGRGPRHQVDGRRPRSARGVGTAQELQRSCSRRTSAST